jgi:hypothetical protein
MYDSGFIRYGDGFEVKKNFPNVNISIGKKNKTEIRIGTSEYEVIAKAFLKLALIEKILTTRVRIPDPSTTTTIPRNGPTAIPAARRFNNDKVYSPAFIIQKAKKINAKPATHDITIT